MPEPKTDSYPLAQIQEAIESLVRAQCFSCLNMKTGFWQITMDEASKQYSAFHSAKHRPFWMWTHVVQAVQCPCHFSEVNAELYRGNEPDILLNLFGWCNSFLKDGGRALETFMHAFEHFWEHNLRLKPTKCGFFWNDINLAHHVSKESVQPSKENLKVVAEITLPQTYTKTWLSWAWWGTIGNSSRGVHMLCNLYRSIYLGKVPIRKASEWHSRGQGCLWD